MEQNILVAIISFIAFFIISSVCIMWSLDNIYKILKDILSALNKKTWISVTETYVPLKEQPKEQPKKTIIYKNLDSRIKNNITFDLGDSVGKELGNRIKEIANDLGIEKYDVYDSLSQKISYTNVISYCYMEFPLYLFNGNSQDQKTWVS